MANKSHSDKEPIQAGRGSKQGYVVAGAILSCSFGTQPTRLKRPFSHGVYVKDKAQMNVTDYLPGTNISNFGRCSCPANPAVKSSDMVDIYGVKKRTVFRSSPDPGSAAKVMCLWRENQPCWINARMRAYTGE